MIIPEELEWYAKIELLPEFYRRVEFQAAIGDIDGPLPWPEELERPGWQVRFTPEGTKGWEIPLPPDLPSGMGAEPASLGPLESEIVTPELVAGVEIMRGLYRVSLGWSVACRKLVVFHAQERSHFAAPPV